MRGFYFVGFVSNPGGGTSITGQVNAVTNGFASDPSDVTSVTVVPFVSTGASITLYFCGDQHNLFPLNKTVRANYTQGILCSLLVRVVIINESEQTPLIPGPKEQRNYNAYMHISAWAS